jgi:N-acetylmuramoyl-L-alanine amidase
MRPRIYIPVLLSFILLLAGANSKASVLKILIDPGHGGQDQGAISGSTHEATLTLQIAKALKKMIDADPRFKAGLTRDTDEFVSLPERTNIAEKNNFNLFLSLHVNASKDPTAKGVEFYFQNQMAPDEEALFLASRENFLQSRKPALSETTASSDLTKIIEDLHRNYKIQISSELSRIFLQEWPQDKIVGHSRTIRQAPFFVISQTTMPSVLVEVGFLSNSEEKAKLTQSSYQREVALNLYRALIKFKESMDKEAAHP